MQRCCCAAWRLTVCRAKETYERCGVVLGAQILREVRVAPLVERTLAEQGQADDTAVGSSGSSTSYAQACSVLPTTLP